MIYSQIPNLLTLIRIAACPVLVLLLYDENYAIALYVFVAAGITDGLDGFIAKRFGFVTGFGAVLDPSADKLLIASAYIMLAVLGDIPFWLLILVMFRDLVIIAGYLILKLMGHSVPISPAYISKINTFLQISLVVVILTEKSGMLTLFALTDLLVYGTCMTTVASGVQYIWFWGIKQDMEVRAGQ